MADSSNEQKDAVQQIVKTEEIQSSDSKNTDSTAAKLISLATECSSSSVTSEPLNSSNSHSTEKETAAAVAPQPQQPQPTDHRPQPSSSPTIRTVTPTNISRSPSPHNRPRGSVTESRFLPDHIEGVAQFIVKLYDLVCDTATSKLITWSEEHNKEAFVVYDPTEFATTILPKYFKHANFCSFVRQLNIYGFRKIESKEGYVFQQENFRYGAPELLKNIQRRKQAHKRPAAPPSSYAPPQRIPGLINPLYAEVPGASISVNPSSQGYNLSTLASACAAASSDTETVQQKLAPVSMLPIPDVITSMRADILTLQKQNIDIQNTVLQLKEMVFQSLKRQEEFETRLQKIETLPTPRFIPATTLSPFEAATLALQQGTTAFPTLTTVKLEVPPHPPPPSTLRP